MMYKFWLWLARLAKKNARQAFHGLSLKCPHCNTWSAEIGGVVGWQEEGDYMRMTCGYCAKSSLWENHGPAWACKTEV